MFNARSGRWCQMSILDMPVKSVSELRRVLVVDDDPVSRIYLEFALKKAGCETVSADSASVAKEVLIATAMKQAGGKAQALYSSRDLERVLIFTRMGFLVELQKMPARE
jgi:hypothetical protein